MSTTANINIRISPTTKKVAQKTLSELGLDLSSGIKMFLEQVIATESIPFSPTTKKGLRLRHGKIYRKEIEWVKKHGKRYKTAEEMHNDILKTTK